MTPLRSFTIILALLAVLTLAPAGPAAAAAPTPAAHLAWGPCPTSPGTTLDPRQECAVLQVPLDYRHPNGGRIALSISRLRSSTPGLRRGVLLLIPGGPGNPGLDGPTARSRLLPREVLDRYDLVGFDPRGVGRSTPVSCGLAAADVAPVALHPWPAPDGDISANVARARRIAAACAAAGGDLIAHIGTLDEAMDMDAIRAALGEERLSYWGVSYGTYVGAVYATLLPRRTDRIVLDSNDDPDPQRVERAWLANAAVGVEDRFPDFAAWAAGRDATYHLGATPAAVRAMFLALAAHLDSRPLPWPGADPGELSGNVLREMLLESLYADAQFPRIASIMLAARTASPLPPNPAPPEQVLQNIAAVQVGTLCNDVAWPRSIAGYARDVAANRVQFPLTAGMPVDIGACSFWPLPPDQPVTITARGPSNVLMVQNLRDVATPYQGALAMREALGGRARLVTVDAGGHGAYLANGNACGDRLVSRFLATGLRPAHDVLCPAAPAFAVA